MVSQNLNRGRKNCINHHVYGAGGAGVLTKTRRWFNSDPTQFARISQWRTHSLTPASSDGLQWWLSTTFCPACMLQSHGWWKPVSWWSRSTKVLVGRPADLLPWVGLHVTSSDTIFPSLLLQWPANCSLLLLIWVVILGRSPYNSLLVIWSFQLASSAFLSIRVLQPSNNLPILLVTVSPCFWPIK